MKIFSIVGARPQFIKLAPLSSLLSKMHDEIIVHTGQHYDYLMSEKIFSDLKIRKPDIHLGIGSGSHANQTANMMIALENAMNDKKPDLVIVFGDTNSTLAGALAAAKINLPILHIEAGLRSYNKSMPEEINRVVTDHISSHLFAPTLNALNILEREGLSNISHLTGDIMVDTLQNNLNLAESKSQILESLNLQRNNYNLLTLHRGYNVDDPLKLVSILEKLEKLKELIIFPVHPRTFSILKKTTFKANYIKFLDPIGFIDFIILEKFSKRIITDSGGIQKEAYILQKPCITLRTETEWIETVDEGWNLLLDPDSNNIAEKIDTFTIPESQTFVFGENVAFKMVEIINKL